LTYTLSLHDALPICLGHVLPSIDHTVEQRVAARADMGHLVDVAPRQRQIQIPRREPRSAHLMPPFRIRRRLGVATLQAAVEAGTVEAPEALKRLVFPFLR